VTCDRSQRSGLPEPGDAAVYQARIERLGSLPADIKLFGTAAAVAFYENVGIRDQRMRCCTSFLLREIEGQRLLAAVDRAEIDAFAAVEGRIVAARITFRTFDLDDLGVEVRQHLRAPRPRQVSAEVDDLDADQRQLILAHGHSPVKLARRFSRKAVMPSCLSLVP
jgi:hypothetical protein